MKVDLREFERKLDTYTAVSSLTCAAAINKKAKDLAMTAASLTPKLTTGAVAADLRSDPHLLAALTSLHLKKHGQGIVGKGKFKSEMDSFLKGRQAGVRYLRAGWAPCIQELGGRYDRNTKSGRGGASKKMILSYAEKATGSNPVAKIVWITEQDNERKREGAERVAGKALEEAIDFQLEDMEKYITRKLSEVFE